MTALKSSLASPGMNPPPPPGASSKPVAAADERVGTTSWVKRFFGRPEFASISGAVLVFAFFVITAGDSGMFNLDGVVNWMQVASYLGIIAIGACLLMIAGEFDLSIGSMIGFAGMMIAIPTDLFPLAAVGRHYFRLRRFHGAGLAQRLHRHQDALAIVHRHPGLPVHPARPDPGPVDHVRQPHHRQRRGRPGGAGLAGQPAVPRQCGHWPVPVDGRAWLDRRARRRLAAGEGHSESHRLVAGAGRRRRVSSCRVPASATGCSPWAATPTRPRMWACRCAR